MRLVADRERCQGHNRCFAEAPELFDLDEDLKAFVVADSVPSGQEAAARAAVRNCPERAITLVDD